MLNLSLGIALMLVLCIIEICLIHFKEKKNVPWREIIFNLNSGHVVLWLGRGIEVWLFDLVLRNFSFHWVGQWNVIVQWVFVLFAWDFCFYWMHRLHHKFAFLWAVHVVHHEGEHFNLSLGIRNSWYSSLTSFPFFAGLAVIGVSTEQFFIIGAFHYFVQFYNHNGFIKAHGFIDWFIVSPSHHKIHHASNVEYRDKNCGGTFTIWDRLFGTYAAEKEGVEMVLGIPSSEPVQENPLLGNNLPFKKYVLKKKIQPIWKGGKRKVHFSEFFIALAGFLVFGLLIFYIYQEDKWGLSHKWILFSQLTFATIAIYGLFQQTIWGLISWIAFVLSLFTLQIFLFEFDWFLLVLVNLLGIYTLLLLFLPKFISKENALFRRV
jgi:sterol desaturase/sphingolipid hydroxylase (fatty acid hydroxylase superfamily)